MIVYTGEPRWKIILRRIIRFFKENILYIIVFLGFFIIAKQLYSIPLFLLSLATLGIIVYKFIHDKIFIKYGYRIGGGSIDINKM